MYHLGKSFEMVRGKFEGSFMSQLSEDYCIAFGDPGIQEQVCQDGV